MQDVVVVVVAAGRHRAAVHLGGVAGGHPRHQDRQIQQTNTGQSVYSIHVSIMSVIDSRYNRQTQASQSVSQPPFAHFGFVFGFYIIN